MFVAQRRRHSLVLVTFGALATVGGAFAASSGPTVQAVTNRALGTKIIVDSGGFTLYHRTSEKKGSISCTVTCRKSWPPLLVVGSAKPVAGAGLSASKLRTVKRPDGGVQVTYNGYALYLYSGDKKAGQTTGQGVAGLWYAITPAGAVTRPTATTAPATTTTARSSTAPTTTSVAPPKTTTTTANGTTVTDVECPQGQTIPQGGGGDADDDNNGLQTDQDGCV